MLFLQIPCTTQLPAKHNGHLCAWFKVTQRGKIEADKLISRGYSFLCKVLCGFGCGCGLVKVGGAMYVCRGGSIQVLTLGGKIKLDAKYLSWHITHSA